MPTVTPENRARILQEAEEGARRAAQQLSTTKKAEKEGEGYVPMTVAEIQLREDERAERAFKYALWRIDAYERGECASPW